VNSLQQETSEVTLELRNKKLVINTLRNGSSS
jgi:hypothetical protein